MSCMTLQEKLEPFGAAMAAVVPNCYHYWRPEMNAPFLVWAEDSDNSLSADNGNDYQAIAGALHYFTKTEYDSAIDSIQTALDQFGASWYLESVQYEDDTNLIHYEWAWEIL